jgi:glycosyltransferase involved in cell wall biosynthesis
MGRALAILTRTAIRALVIARPVIGPIYRLLPSTVRNNVRSYLVKQAKLHREPSCSQMHLERGITLIGYPLADFGMGEALRSLANAAMAAEVPTEAYNFSLHVHAHQTDTSAKGILTSYPRKGVNVFCLNPNLLDETIGALGASVLEGRYNVVRPFWELPAIPRNWVPTLDAIDEVWAPTEFVANAFRARTQRPVTHIPVAISQPTPLRLPKSHFGLSERSFVFVFSFDFGSYVVRKNPLGVVAAFKKAFPDLRNDKVSLVIKMMGEGPGRRRTILDLKAIRRSDSRIHLIDAPLSRSELNALISASDCYVSLHRSEGFGLSIAEAMSLGKPVIATDYSGNVDFLNTSNGFPVPYRLVDVGKGEYPNYEVGQQWAEPDLDEAADRMRYVLQHPGEAGRLGELARAFIEQRHGAKRVGRIIIERLTAVGVY